VPESRVQQANPGSWRPAHRSWQERRPEGEHLSGVFMIMSIVMFMSRRVAAIGSLCMDMTMVVTVTIAKRMFMSMNMGVLMPVHMGAGLANAIGVNMLRLVI
jgi:hypothetical protein